MEREDPIATDDGCTGRLVEYDDQPNWYTIYDRSGGTSGVTAWISAPKGSYVDLSDWQ